jgi:mRNA interferase RelE/StbE
VKYKVLFSEEAKKQLKKIDKYVQALIIGWIEKNLQCCENPRVHGKGLTSNRSGQWRYRIRRLQINL